MAVCREHGVALSSAALQFPYAHKVVATVLTGLAQRRRGERKRGVVHGGAATGVMGRVARKGPVASVGARTDARHGSMRMNVERIDAHQHFWDPSRGDYGWLTPQLTSLYRIYGFQ